MSTGTESSTAKAMEQSSQSTSCISTTLHLLCDVWARDHFPAQWGASNISSVHGKGWIILRISFSYVAKQPFICCYATEQIFLPFGLFNHKLKAMGEVIFYLIYYMENLSLKWQQLGFMGNS